MRWARMPSNADADSTSPSRRSVDAAGTRAPDSYAAMFGCAMPDARASSRWVRPAACRRAAKDCAVRGSKF